MDRNLLSIVAVFGAVSLVIVMMYGAIILGNNGSGEKVEITACVVAKIKGNATYMGAAGMTTRLKCALMNDVTPTLIELYGEGWRIVSIVERQNKAPKAKYPPSPLYYVERVSQQSIVEW